MQRHLMARAVVATAALALGVLVLFELNFAGDRTQARPAMLSIEEAVVQLRSQQAAGQTSAGLAPANPASLGAARDAYGRSAQMLDAAWTALPPDQSAQLTQAQRLWLWKRNAACEAAIAPGAGDPVARESSRLKCKGEANQQRAAWLKQYVPAASTGPSAVPSSATAPVTSSLGPAEACAWMRARAAHLGQSLSFEGEYLNDHGGPAMVRPIGCDQAIVLREMDPAARMTLERVDLPPSATQPRHLVALFTARLVHAGVSVSDDAVRLHVAEITNVQVVSGR